MLIRKSEPRFENGFKCTNWEMVFGSEDIFADEIFDLVKDKRFKIEKSEETPRYIENPEWKKQQIKNEINRNTSLIGMYEEQILKCRDENKKLEKELNGK